jgi:hypothetical protein
MIETIIIISIILGIIYIIFGSKKREVARQGLAISLEDYVKLQKNPIRINITEYKRKWH